MRPSPATRRAELLVAGRASARRPGLARAHDRGPDRALIEERGLRTASPAAASTRPGSGSGSVLGAPARPRRPGGARRAARPSSATRPSSTAASCSPTASAPTSGAGRAPEDRFASDLLLPERIADPWLRALTPVRARRADPDRPRRPHARRARAPPGAAATMDGLVDLDRGPGPPDLDVPSDPELVAAIRDEIARDGPMTFARFMELALYDPERGYYRSRRGAAGPRRRLPDGARGPPDLRPGDRPARDRRVARRSDRPAPFTIREHGAGDGRPGRAARRRRSSGGPEPAAAAARVRYLVVEVDDRRVAAARERLAALGLPPGAVDDRGRRRPADRGARPRQRGPRRPADPSGRRQRGGALRRGPRRRSTDGGARRRRGGRRRRRPSRPASPPRASTLADGQRAEICLATDAWVARAAGGPRTRRRCCSSTTATRPPSSTTRRAAPRGTLARTVGHRVHDDPYRAIGRQDLTAHVDVTAVERGGRARPASTHLGDDDPGRVPRPARDRRSARRRCRPGPARRCRRTSRRASALVRMIDPAAMGGFRGPRLRPRPAGRRVAPRAAPPPRRPRPDRTGLAAKSLSTRAPADAHAAARRWARPHVRVVGHRRGADRELARALGAIRSPPTSAAPSQRTRPAARSRARAAGSRRTRRPSGAAWPVRGGPPLLE